MCLWSSVTLAFVAAWPTRRQEHARWDKQIDFYSIPMLGVFFPSFFFLLWSRLRLTEKKKSSVIFYIFCLTNKAPVRYAHHFHRIHLVYPISSSPPSFRPDCRGQEYEQQHWLLLLQGC